MGDEIVNRAQTVDAAVLGAGAAGMAAALERATKGIDVPTLEVQQPEKHTPHLRMSGWWAMTLSDAVAGTRCLAACAHGIPSRPRIDRWAQLAALDGCPIPGLLGAGELGQAIGVLYAAAGAALSDALCSGLVVGEFVGEGASRCDATLEDPTWTSA